MAKLTKIKTSNTPPNRIEKIKTLINIYSIVRGIKINETECLVLAAFLTEGVNTNTKEMLLNEKLVKNKNVLANVLTKMRGKGLIVKDGFREKVNHELSLNYDNTILWEMEIK